MLSKIEEEEDEEEGNRSGKNHKCNNKGQWILLVVKIRQFCTAFCDYAEKKKKEEEEDKPTLVPFG